MHDYFQNNNINDVDGVVMTWKINLSNKSCMCLFAFINNQDGAVLYDPDEPVTLCAEDQALLDENNSNASLRALKGRHDPNFEATWLIHSYNLANSRSGSRLDNSKYRNGQELSAEEKELMDKETPHEDKRMQQCEEIEKVFEAAKAFDDVRNIVHPVKKNLKAVKSLPINPFLEINDPGGYSLYQAKFEDAPGNNTMLQWCEEDADNEIASTEAVMTYNPSRRLNDSGRTIQMLYYLPTEKPGTRV